MDDVDDATNALIAHLLAEDTYDVVNPSIYGPLDDDSDEEEERKRRKKRRKKKTSTAAQRKPKAPKKKKTTTNANGDKKKRATPRAWTDEEEKLFRESLELYGRDWKRCSEHIKTREPKAISSHCQKYFIKLYKENLPLPDKVKESGEGYTLSGKPLDPNSAAARAYGLKGSAASREYRIEKAFGRENKKNGESAAASVEIPFETTSKHFMPSSEGLSARDRNDMLLAEAKQSGKPLGQITDGSRRSRSVKLQELIQHKMLAPGMGVIRLAYQDREFLADLQENGMLLHNGQEYDSVSGFSIAMKRMINPDKMADCGWKSCTYNGETLEKIKERYLGMGVKQVPSSGVVVDPRVAAMARKRQQAEQVRRRKAEQWAKRQAMHRHHYDENGQTAYSRGRARRTATTRFVSAPSSELTFVRCTDYLGTPGSGMPMCQPFKVVVRSSVYALVDVHSHLSTAEVMGFLAGSWDPNSRTITVCEAFPGRSLIDGATECEMDPVVEVELRANIESKGYTVVGWYHSHPTFQAIPSSCDIDNQANYQALFRDGKNQTEPFIGLIDSPYDEYNPSATSRFSWFYVDSPALSKEAKVIRTLLQRCDTIDPDVLERMVELVRNKDVCSSRSIDFNQVWREVPGVGLMTYASKFKKSVSMWLPQRSVQMKQHQQLVVDETALHPLLNALGLNSIA